MTVNIDRVVTALRSARGLLPRTVDKSGRVLPLPSPRDLGSRLGSRLGAVSPPLWRRAREHQRGARLISSGTRSAARSIINHGTRA
ncbi:MAG: hypothetical protein AB7S70_14315 [Hyphomicrobium sp.]|uniref:hypothetical protein n=1 Tax=Hyphomicrobium sp. TaxID=82 RepID=UPI003D11DA9B